MVVTTYTKNHNCIPLFSGEIISLLDKNRYFIEIRDDILPYTTTL